MRFVGWRWKVMQQVALAMISIYITQASQCGVVCVVVFRCLLFVVFIFLAPRRGTRKINTKNNNSLPFFNGIRKWQAQSTAINILLLLWRWWRWSWRWLRLQKTLKQEIRRNIRIYNIYLYCKKKTTKYIYCKILVKNLCIIYIL
jgi:hypothetical protein